MSSTRNLYVTIASAAIAFAAFIGGALAQPGPARQGPGWGWMGPGMMDSQSFGRMCSPASAGFAEWQMNRVAQLINPTESQRAKFEEYKVAATKAAADMRSACPTSFPATMPERMQMMEKRSEAMLQAIKSVRPTLEAFYATLTDEQKKRLDSTSGPGRFWRWRETW